MQKRRRTHAYSRAVVGVTATLLGVFVVDHFTSLGLSYRWALQPTDLVRALRALSSDPSSGDAWWAVVTVWTSVLVHANLPHVASNVAFFWFFGTLVADVVGERWVLLSFAATALTSGLAFVVHTAFISQAVGGSVVGASGAISGVAGFYCLLAFRWEIPAAYAWPLSRPVAPLQAAAVALIAFVTDLFVLRSGVADGIARDAHVGGFAGGVLLAAVLTTAFPTWEAFRRSRFGRITGAP